MSVKSSNTRATVLTDHNCISRLRSDDTVARTWTLPTRQGVLTSEVGAGQKDGVQQHDSRHDQGGGRVVLLSPGVAVLHGRRRVTLRKTQTVIVPNNNY